MKIKVLGIITARGQSKGIPQKNIINCAGKPLIYHTIAAAQKSQLTDFVVSTDNEQIASISQNFGAKVPFLRPAKLATDHSKSYDTIIYTLKKYENMTKIRFDYVMTLQPTSPLRTYDDIDQAIKICENDHPESLVSIEKLNFPPEKIKFFDGKYLTDALLNEKEGTRRQEYPDYYKRNGAIFMTRRDILMNGSLFGDQIQAFEMPKERSIDIDSRFDLLVADLLLRQKNENS